MPIYANLSGKGRRSHLTSALPSSTIWAVLMSGLLFLGACHRNSLSIPGLWELDREMTYQAAEQKANQTFGANAAKILPQIRKDIDADIVFYDFAPNGSVEIRYQMTSVSHGLERGTWKQEGQHIIVSTYKDQGSEAGRNVTRDYEVVGDRLRWLNDSGLAWYLKRKGS